MNPVLVTGASGFLGRQMVRTLVRQGFDAVSVFHTAGFDEDRRHFRLDLRDAAALQKLFRQFQFSAVVYLAASGVSAEAENFQDLVAINTLGQRHRTFSLRRLGFRIPSAGPCHG